MAGGSISDRVLRDQGNLIRRYLATIMALLEERTRGRILDIGCAEGLYSSLFGTKLKGNDFVGVDIDSLALGGARSRGIEVVRASADLPLPFPDETFSVVISNQVIEHLQDVDLFAEEVFRVLTKDGYGIIATENLASWHNVLALALGYQPFTENVSKVRRIGNPFAQNYGQTPRFDNLHIKVFTYHSYLEFLELHRFNVVEAHGIGYHPIPSFVSALFSRIDPRHSRYIVAKVRRR